MLSNMNILRYLVRFDGNGILSLAIIKNLLYKLFGDYSRHNRIDDAVFITEQLLVHLLRQCKENLQ
jgi:hypothetical protein